MLNCKISKKFLSLEVLMPLAAVLDGSWRVGVRSTIAASIDIFTSVKCASLGTGITLGGSKVFNEPTWVSKGGDHFVGVGKVPVGAKLACSRKIGVGASTDLAYCTLNRLAIQPVDILQEKLVKTTVSSNSRKVRYLWIVWSTTIRTQFAWWNCIGTATSPLVIQVCIVKAVVCCSKNGLVVKIPTVISQSCHSIWCASGTSIANGAWFCIFPRTTTGICQSTCTDNGTGWTVGGDGLFQISILCTTSIGQPNRFGRSGHRAAVRTDWTWFGNAWTSTNLGNVDLSVFVGLQIGRASRCRGGQGGSKSDLIARVNVLLAEWVGSTSIGTHLARKIVGGDASADGWVWPRVKAIAWTSAEFLNIYNELFAHRVQLRVGGQIWILISVRTQLASLRDDCSRCEG